MLKKFIYVSLIVLLAQSASAQNPADSYIETYKEAAVSVMNQHGIPASVILGIAIHESASGTSKIARYLNNHFGIKGKEGPKKIRSSYKGYESVQECYTDFVNFLQGHFSNLFTKYTPADYRGWTFGMQRGGYAKSRVWAGQIIAIINKYRLYELDSAASSFAAESVLKPAILTEAASEPLIYLVKKGDTLLEIAKRFGTTVKEIKLKNDLTGSLLSIGQKLQL